MEAQIKEETKEESLVCLDTSGDTNLASLSLVEKYSRYVQNEDADIDSDCDFFPDDTVLREQFAVLARDAHTFPQAKSHRLSVGLTVKQRDPVDTDEKKPDSCLNELLKKLSEVRRCEPDGNSIFCNDEQELLDIQDRYGDILSYLQEKSSSFSRKSSPKDSENDEQVDVGNAAPEEQRESMKLLAEKIVSVQQARDLFYELEQQVREQIEQLELVERYKMESVS
jgi:hypothetical protein